MPTVNDVYENLPADQLWRFGINSSSTHVALSTVVGFFSRTHAVTRVPHQVFRRR
ncbi:cobalt transporter CbtA [Klebsiella quasipneumoniae]|nr:cobalt transporter CbtA [Klebsiella quasipneumoniae]